jgi:hypothetical protein
MSKFAIPVRAVFRKRLLHDSMYVSSYHDMIGVDDGWGGDLRENLSFTSLFVRKQYSVGAESLKVSSVKGIDELRHRINQAV